jgi:hypothetical protein
MLLARCGLPDGLVSRAFRLLRVLSAPGGCHPLTKPLQCCSEPLNKLLQPVQASERSLDALEAGEALLEPVETAAAAIKHGSLA